jgi:hypothetical protein
MADAQCTLCTCSACGSWLMVLWDRMAHVRAAMALRVCTRSALPSSEDYSACNEALSARCACAIEFHAAAERTTERESRGGGGTPGWLKQKNGAEHRHRSHNKKMRCTQRPELANPLVELGRWNAHGTGSQSNTGGAALGSEDRLRTHPPPQSGSARSPRHWAPGRS